ncbi:hypothetical protein GH733_004668 [Mirounga leonina]|nr:hypothetical protein GH733_004668 [Mirounga leonina]
MSVVACGIDSRGISGRPTVSSLNSREYINQQCISFSVSSQQCSKKASVSLLWLLKSSGIIADRPWPRVSLTVLTTAIILTMAVFNMCFRMEQPTMLGISKSWGVVSASGRTDIGKYFIYSCILGLISCSVFLRVNYELKMLIMMVALVGYNTILLHTHAHVLDDYSQVLFER